MKLKLREYWNKKTLKQRIYLCVGIVLALFFLLFFIKGNFIDSHISDVTKLETSQSSDPNEKAQTAESGGFDLSDIPWIDLGVLAALFTAYGIHKYREKKRERRL